jgi:uncharacterized membrane protein HdeD (DUF308 family)
MKDKISTVLIVSGTLLFVSSGVVAVIHLFARQVVPADAAIDLFISGLVSLMVGIYMGRK